LDKLGEAKSIADKRGRAARRIGRQVCPGRYTVRDHDYRRQPSCKLIASAEAGDRGVEARLEQYHYVSGAFLFRTEEGENTPFADDKGKTRADVQAGEILVRKRLEAKRTSARMCEFETNAHDLSPGVVMSMLDHPKSELGSEEKLLIVESTLNGASHGEWKHRCEARCADSSYRPPLSTPKPTVNGVESATVVGPPGEEIHCDEFGRVRVHFHWDRESKMDDNSSCWIHVSQPWGGAGYGAMNLPRVGQEVLVDFLGGDPDRPMIVGRVYTNLQKVPYKLPEHKTRSGWRSQSSPGGGGFNEIRFEDAKGKEEVYIQAENNLRKLVKNNENVSIRGNRSTQVGRIDSTLVGEMHSVMISPPGEGGLDEATAWTMEKDRIVFSTPGGAKITLEGGTIRLEAPEMIHAFGKASCALWSFGQTTIGGIAGLTLGSSAGDVNIRGGPLVKVNT
jgi:type VI secretion system secreted protein VgrG